MIPLDRLSALRIFYGILDELSERTGGPFILSDCTGRFSWPRRGVYFFFESGELRSDSGDGFRVVRVGTHALGQGSGTKLWNRLSQHAGSRGTGAGNHRGSIFRLLVGEAMMRRGKMEEPRSWGIGGDPGAAALRLGYQREQVKAAELQLEQSVSRYICAMPFLFVAVDDEPGSDSQRGVIERGAIALLSNYQRSILDAPSASWLGTWSGRDRVRESSLWNNNHVEEEWDADFLDQLEIAADKSGPLVQKKLGPN